MNGPDSAVWKKADAYFSTLTGNGLSADEASAMTDKMVEFTMALNVDGLLAGNEYQNTEWGYHNTIQLERVDGEMNLKKVDSENEEVIADKETRFQLWYYKDTDGDETYTDLDDKYYYTAYETTETDPETSETVTKTTYGFVKYDPANSSMRYTIDTTGGHLDISYAMLEGMIYYLQENVAPEGYELDKTVYIICDDEETATKARNMMRDPSVDIAEEEVFSYAGRISSQKALEVKVVNTKIPVVPDEPEPEDPVVPDEPEPEEPVVPDEPEPEEPVVPDEPEPEDPVVPDEPEPEDPVVPDEPEPEDPVVPDEPEPEEPVVPEVPETPEQPEEPVIPEIPVVPEMPELPEIPEEQVTEEEPVEEEPETQRRYTGTVTIVDYMAPLAGQINMNEGDCFN